MPSLPLSDEMRFTGALRGLDMQSDDRQVRENELPDDDNIPL